MANLKVCKLIEILRKGHLVYSLEQERVRIFYVKDGYFDLINGSNDYKIVADVEENSTSINLTELPLDLRAEVTTKVSELLNVGIDLARNVLAEFPEVKEENGKIILLANPINYSKYFLGFVEDIEAWLKVGKLIKAVAKSQENGYAVMDNFVIVSGVRTIFVYNGRTGYFIHERDIEQFINYAVFGESKLRTVKPDDFEIKAVLETINGVSIPYKDELLKLILAERI
ncbi:hypothetical protein [Archaeoglobus fulgidus]|uniref:hypothetical protein n=1 Tax=Archaeoglobus fulgidus TaxID=2234 RepID=UPI0012DF0DBE|nr:hypothetical protein [Archaeoglobus fulgidus]